MEDLNYVKEHGPNESFYLVPLDEMDFVESCVAKDKTKRPHHKKMISYMSKFHHERETNLELPTHVLRYFGDQLKWIPSQHFFGGREMSGLSLESITAIRAEGGRKIVQIFSGWIKIFEKGPEELVLTGPYCFGDENEDGYYIKIKVKRDWLIGKLKKFVELGNVISETDTFLIHRGL